MISNQMPSNTIQDIVDIVDIIGYPQEVSNSLFERSVFDSLLIDNYVDVRVETNKTSIQFEIIGINSKLCYCSGLSKQEAEEKTGEINKRLKILDIKND